MRSYMIFKDIQRKDFRLSANEKLRSNLQTFLEFNSLFEARRYLNRRCKVDEEIHRKLNDSKSLPTDIRLHVGKESSESSIINYYLKIVDNSIDLSNQNFLLTTVTIEERHNYALARSSEKITSVKTDILENIRDLKKIVKSFDFRRIVEDIELHYEEYHEGKEILVKCSGASYKHRVYLQAVTESKGES